MYFFAGEFARGSRRNRSLTKKIRADCPRAKKHGSIKSVGVVSGGGGSAKCGGGAQRDGGSAVAAARRLRRWRLRDSATSQST